MTKSITDEKLAEFDENAYDDRCSINMYYYKQIRERIRLADRLAAANVQWNHACDITKFPNETYIEDAHSELDAALAAYLAATKGDSND